MGESAYIMLSERSQAQKRVSSGPLGGRCQNGIKVQEIQCVK